MIPEAEALLLATGLLKLPDRTSVRAARAIEKELVAGLKAALMRDNPGRLYAIQAPRNYFERLVKFTPDYGPLIETLGPELGAEYQVAQMTAATSMRDRYPKVTVDTVRGPRPVDASEIETNLYVILADTVEDYMRLVRDFAAGVLVPAQVLLFQEFFPETYKLMLYTIQDEMIMQSEEWLPPLWLSDSIKVLRQVRLGTMVRREIKPEGTPPPGRLKLDDVIEAAGTPTDK